MRGRHKLWRLFWLSVWQRQLFTDVAEKVSSWAATTLPMSRCCSASLGLFSTPCRSRYTWPAASRTLDHSYQRLLCTRCPYCSHLQPSQQSPIYAAFAGAADGRLLSVSSLTSGAWKVMRKRRDSRTVSRQCEHTGRCVSTEMISKYNGPQLWQM